MPISGFFGGNEREAKVNLEFLISSLKRSVLEIPKVYPRIPKRPQGQRVYANLRPIDAGVFELSVGTQKTAQTSEIESAIKQTTSKEALILHAFYADVALEILAKVDPDSSVDLVLTGSDLEVLKKVMGSRPQNNCVAFKCENVGRDVFPFLLLSDLHFVSQYELVWKLHTKKSPHVNYGQEWLSRSISGLMELRSQYSAILERFGTDIPLMFGVDSLDMRHRLLFNYFWMKALVGKVPKNRRFFPGSMFICNGLAIQAICEANLIRYRPDGENGQLDGTFAHAVERIFGYLVESRLGKMINFESKQ